MSEATFRHHTGGSMDFKICEGEPTLPAGKINNYLLKAGSFEDQISFQNGPANGIPNGFSIEVVLEVCMLRLQGFNQGEFECTANHVAIEKIAGAIDALKDRTADRKGRGVIGTLQP